MAVSPLTCCRAVLDTTCTARGPVQISLYDLFQSLTQEDESSGTFTEDQ
jgi:hypothetical protein